ncbi:MAG: TIGR00282 family metallophosphoesterase [Alphaproteobacteria bacterium]
MNLLFLGDIAASSGRTALAKHLPLLREKYALDCVIANGENSHSTSRGITEDTAQEIFRAGVDVITLGDHTFDQKGVEVLLAQNQRIIRPANYPQGTVGRGHTVFTTASGKRVGVINLQGRVFINQQTDCPFQKAKALMDELRLGDTVDALVVDIHAEATSEKCLMGYVWDGKASLVVGTHTHIPTNDARIQPKGTAYQSDAGMCGDYNSSLGMSFESVLPHMLQRGRFKFEPASGEGTLCGVLVTVGANGLATHVQSIKVGGVLGE